MTHALLEPSSPVRWLSHDTRIAATSALPIARTPSALSHMCLASMATDASVPSGAAFFTRRNVCSLRLSRL
eukprot:5683688-Pleurochrysis_carterae.AAC.1